MALGYSCSKCHRPLQSTEGCGICRDFKRCIVITGQDEVSPFDVVLKNVRMLEDQLKDYGKEIAGAKDPEAREHARECVRQVGAKVAVLADAYRKLMADRQAAVSSMTLEEQRNLFVSWYRGLTANLRNAVAAALATAEAELNQPVTGWSNPFAAQ